MATSLIEFGEFNGIAISARDDQYLNATQMCKAGGKLWGHYWQNADTQAVAKRLASDIGIPITELVVTIRGGNERERQRQGTWIHRKLAIHLAQWISPEFWVFCINRLDELFLTGRTSINREHAEFALVRAAIDKIGVDVIEPMTRALVGIGTDLTSVKQTVEEHTERLDDLTGSMKRVESQLTKKRKEVSEADKRRHIAVVIHRYNGICPCCEINKVIDDNGRFVGEVDHWFSPSMAKITETMPTCSECNNRMGFDSGYRRAHNGAFESYQRRLAIHGDFHRQLSLKMSYKE